MKQSRTLSPAMVFILIFGMVSLFSDMTHEGAASMRGAYLSFLGASAATIGFVSGLGEHGWVVSPHLSFIWRVSR